MKKVTMLGAGSWGTALALVLTDNGNEVCVWAHRSDLIHQINELHENKDYLPNVKLPTTIKGTTDMNEAVSDADFIIVAVPTKAIREVLRQAVPFMTKKTVFVHVS
ncbi:NAD(P)-binding domain-containing protein, partial [Bacillus spizizenii]|nr:NAD(P)-binding domain-containing protein [Bacillus spizizenii]